MHGLIIDDESLVLSSTAMLLKNIGVTASTAGNGREGLALARSEKPDFILLDLIMPDMNGWDVMDGLQSSIETSDIPVIVFTAGEYRVSEAEAFSRGIAGILEKPFHLDHLVDAIDNACSQTCS